MRAESSGCRKTAAGTLFSLSGTFLDSAFCPCLLWYKAPKGRIKEKRAFLCHQKHKKSVNRQLFLKKDLQFLSDYGIILIREIYVLWRM